MVIYILEEDPYQNYSGTLTLDFYLQESKNVEPSRMYVVVVGWFDEDDKVWGEAGEVYSD